MIESGSTTRMSGIHENPGQSHHTSAQEYSRLKRRCAFPEKIRSFRILLTTDPSQLKNELPGDLQSLSWLTSVDVPRLQQIGGRRPEFSSSAQNSLLDQQTAQMTSMTAGGAGSAIHLQSEMQHSPLAINSMPQFSPGFPCAASVYQTTPHQQVHTYTQANQQCSPGGLYGNFNSQSLYPQVRMNSHNQDLQPKTFPKPIYSYSCLIAMALKNSKTGSLPVSEIYSFMKEHFPYFKTAPDGWKNSVRHNLSLNKCFEKVENKMSGSSRKGCLWALNPAKIDKMEEEMQKWKRKDLPAIRRSMANPDELDKLITDRPESCRQKSVDTGMTRLPSCPPGHTLPVPAHLQSQPMVTLSLQCLPMQHHLQLQLQSQSRLAPASPAPAQTPPLLTVPDLMNSSLLQHHTKQLSDFYSIHTDANSEVDALDPSIMDFSWQGNLWEDMKDDSFNLEALGTISNSPLRLSDCDLDTGHSTPVSNAGGLSYPDLQVTGLYSAYSAVDALSNQYMNTQGATKPIVLL
ncbi:forkhead box protein N4 isoform X1 [Triplophysa dalaica]|uniref:forkhead box protein N4 isoform X1 n=2 Tax=Triplophysa dalaica TaxID=1582913 RepID=UPI0024DFAF73|nr:forkhead box protein N4 isoform X1 [Triplophysa dalaica]XP_056601996.1 forkhead box protein N4 isoform X1 [Triplophysa dalaica]